MPSAHVFYSTTLLYSNDAKNAPVAIDVCRLRSNWTRSRSRLCCKAAWCSSCHGSVRLSYGSVVLTPLLPFVLKSYAFVHAVSMPTISHPPMPRPTGPHFLDRRTPTARLLRMSCGTRTSFQGLAPKPVPYLDFSDYCTCTESSPPRSSSAALDPFPFLALPLSISSFPILPVPLVFRWDSCPSPPCHRRTRCELPSYDTFRLLFSLGRPSSGKTSRANER